MDASVAEPVSDMGGITGPVVFAGGAAASSPASTPGSSLFSSPMGWYQPRLKYPKLYVFGGWNGKSGLNDLHVLDTDTNEWSVPWTTGPTPATRNNHATFVYGSRLVVHGGHDGLKWLADLHVLDTERMEWSQPVVSGVMPSARACHTTTLLGRKVYMFGGYDGVRCFDSLDVLDLDTMTWLQPRVSGAVPMARNAQTVTVVGTKLFLFGGHSGNRHLRDLHVLDSETMTWHAPEVKGAVPPGLRGHTANLIGSRIFLFGGYDGRGRSNDLYLLDTASLKWDHPLTTESTPAGRQRHTACLVHAKKLFVMGGFDGFKWLSDCHVLDVGKLEEQSIAHASLGSLLSDLGTLVNNPDSFPDVSFTVSGRPVYAHKSILAARSAHFRAMFASGFREGRELDAPVDYGDQWSSSAFVVLLEFLYTGNVQGQLAGPVAEEVMSLAQYTGVEGLKSLCETALIHSIDATTVCSLISTAHRCQAPELKRVCLDFILKHSDAVNLEALSSEPILLIEITREVIARSSKS